MSTPTPAAQRFRRIIPLILAIAAAVLVPVSFVLGITAALDGGGAGAGVFTALFFAGFLLAITALVTAVVLLAGGAPRAPQIAAMVIALLPLAGVLVLYVIKQVA